MTAQHTLSRVELDVRRATVADADGIIALFDRVYGGEYRSAECTDPLLVRRELTGRDCIWMLVTDRDRVVGSIAARRTPGSGRYEMCRAAVDSAHRGRSEIVAAFDAVLRETLRQPDCELMFADVRSERARRKFGPGAVPVAWTSADHGMHRMHGRREEHLFGMAFPPQRTVIRLVPPRSVVLPGSPVAAEIARLRSAVIVGDYPARICAGGVGEHRYESSNGRVSYSMIAPSRAAVVRDMQADTPADARRLLWELLDGAASAEIDHLTMFALADKLPLIEELCRPGVAEDPARRFRLCGYRPGWHPAGGARFDCVTLVARTDEQVPDRWGLQERIGDVYRSFRLWV
ncbi:hypothetical protein [Mangrovihabitans endophyticus]|uniref:N-acetyltransferase domain-containing protein n=1 Tax=Mangrovihabitans endophyticus TaxID=1751298 RepID=A0A8J3C5V6_9ACTN|nr:hypothetical protein [Mangrovihabitans endophyticus]GGL13624.1 hypothetical protein GCM10012284_55540 [Mangrovihabitans endophyticus]